MKRLLALGIVVGVGSVVGAWRLLPSQGDRRERPSGASIAHRMMARMMERLPEDSPPKLIMSILPRLREQNDEIIALLREHNELLRQGRRGPVTS